MHLIRIYVTTRLIQQRLIIINICNLIPKATSSPNHQTVMQWLFGQFVFHGLAEFRARSYVFSRCRHLIEAKVTLQNHSDTHTHINTMTRPGPEAKVCLPDQQLPCSLWVVQALQVQVIQVGNSCRSGTGPIFIQNIVNSLLSVLFSGLKQ